MQEHQGEGRVLLVEAPSEAAELNSEPRNTHMRIYHNRSFNLYENKQTNKKNLFSSPRKGDVLTLPLYGPVGERLNPGG